MYHCGNSGAQGEVTIKNILSEPLMACTWSKDGWCRFKSISGCLIGHRSGHAANANCLVSVVRPQHENYSNKRKFLHNHKPFKPFVPKPVTYEISPRSAQVLDLMGIAV